MCTTLFNLAAVAAATVLVAQPAVAGEEDNVRVRTRSVVVADDDGSSPHTFEVSVDNGEIMIRMDGKEVTGNRIESKDGNIVILDEGGNELRSFTLLPKLGGKFAFDFGDGSSSSWNTNWAQPGEQPSVMLGVLMAEPDEALRYHLRLEPGETTMISGLYKGLPARKAGLDRFDIIVAVDGRRPATGESIREVLAHLEPGDKITFTVIHAGREREVDVELEAFDRERMDPSALIGGNSFSTDFSFVVPDEGEGEGAIFLPRGSMEWMLDPDTKRRIEKWVDPDMIEERITEALRDHVPRDLDDRLERLSVRIDDLKTVIDALIDQAQDLAEEYEYQQRDRERDRQRDRDR